MILSKEEVKKLPEPESILMGDYYNVPKKDYKRLKATATQVEKIKKVYQKKEEELSRRSADLGKKKKEIENKRKLPIKDRMELNALRIFKSKVAEIVNMMPESKIKSLLQMALEEKEAPRNIVTMERKKDKNIAI